MPARLALDGGADVAQGAAGLRGSDTGRECRAGGGHQAPAPSVHRADRHGPRGVGVVAIQLGRDIERDQLAGANDPGPGNAVHDFLVDRDAYRGGVVVGQDRPRLRAVAGKGGRGEPVELGRAHARSHRALEHAERLGHDLAGSPESA